MRRNCIDIFFFSFNLKRFINFINNHFYKYSGFLIVIEAHCSIIFIIGLIIKESNPHTIDLPRFTIHQDLSLNAYTADIGIIILYIFNNQNKFRLRLIQIILNVQCDRFLLGKLSSIFQSQHIYKLVIVLHEASSSFI